MPRATTNGMSHGVHSYMQRETQLNYIICKLSQSIQYLRLNYHKQNRQSSTGQSEGVHQLAQKCIELGSNLLQARKSRCELQRGTVSHSCRQDQQFKSRTPSQRRIPLIWIALTGFTMLKSDTGEVKVLLLNTKHQELRREEAENSKRRNV